MLGFEAEDLGTLQNDPENSKALSFISVFLSLTSGFFFALDRVYLVEIRNYVSPMNGVFYLNLTTLLMAAFGHVFTGEKISFPPISLDNLITYLYLIINAGSAFFL